MARISALTFPPGASGGDAMVTNFGSAATTTAYSLAVLADTPGVYLKLDEPSGTTMADSSTNHTDGTYTPGGEGISPTLNQAPLITVGKSVACVAASKQAAQWTPSSGTIIAGTNLLTVEAWIKSSTTGVVQQVFCCDDQSFTRFVQFRVNASNQIEAVIFDNAAAAHTVTGSANVMNGTRHQTALTYDGANAVLYVDGAQDTTTPLVITMPASCTTTWQVARRVSSGVFSGYFTGNIDELSVYKSALSAARIAAHFTAGTT